MKCIKRILAVAIMMLVLCINVLADGEELNSTANLDKVSIELSKLINRDSNQISNEYKDSLLKSGIKITIDSKEERVYAENKDSSAMLQFIGLDIIEENGRYGFAPAERFQIAARLRGSQIDTSGGQASLKFLDTKDGVKDSYLVLDILSAAGTIRLNTYDSITFSNKPAANLGLYNRNNPLDRQYVPDDMVRIPKKIKAAHGKPDLSLKKEASANLAYMLDLAYLQGVRGYIITSTYRNYAYQETLYNNKVNSLKRTMKTGYADRAATIVARPGTSEHQSGLALDITIRGIGLESDFSKTTQGQWLDQNSWRFGYVIRYKAEKSNITGIIDEPWHLRYVGYPYSKVMYDYNLCLEEYISYIKDKGFYAVKDKDIIYFTICGEDGKTIVRSNPIKLQ